MNWIKGKLTGSGRPIGEGKDEAVFLNISNGLMIVKDGELPAIKHISSMSQYEFTAFDDSFIKDIMGVQETEVKELEIEKPVKVKKK